MKRYRFPKDFLWGAATSSHQVEGGNEWNDWWSFEEQGRVKNNDKSGPACDHYNRYEEDFNIAKSLGMNAQRISIEWSRIEKEEGKFDKNEIEHYKKVLSYLKNNGFTTMVTMHHFTNPLWFSSLGGWTSKKSVEYFSRYAKYIFDELNEYVDFWATLNEPYTPFAVTGYLTGYWPPNKRNPYLFFKALKNLSAAHNKVYDLIKEENPLANIGVVTNHAPYIPQTFLDKPIRKILNYIRNFYFTDKLHGHMDFFGINYYFPLSKWISEKDKTDMGWPIYSGGIKTTVMDCWDRYQIPIYITENGIASKDDSKRINFIKDHLIELHKAITKGADVRGYFHWSLLDNFEWREGFSPRFGLIKVDYESQKRTIKKSAKYYGEICKTNNLEV